MKYYRFSARLLAPLLIQQKRQSNAPQGLPYLPGSTLRGAVAAQFLRAGGQPDDPDFKSLFLPGGLSFPDLFPSSDPLVVSRVLPLTAFSCKRSPGFRTESAHGVRDTLHHVAFARIFGVPVTLQSRTCPECGNDLKPFSGSWSGPDEICRRFQTAITFDRHTGIDRATGTVATSIFYTTQAMSNYRKSVETGEYEIQYLTGGIYAREDQIQVLERILPGSLFAGADRSRGMGEIVLSVNSAESPLFDVAEWSDAFVEKVRNLAGKSLPEGLYFTVNLESHAIFVDQYLRPVPRIDVEFPDVRLVALSTKSQAVRGWHAGYGLAKPDDQALVMGSVFLFCYRGTDSTGLEQYLQSLAIFGMGLRREEGFGRVSICNPFHTMEVI
jgi:CRISPR-associated protein Csx10